MRNTNYKLACHTPLLWYVNVMANITAFIFGIIALILAIVALIPLLGWANWIILPIAAIGAIIGMASERNSGRNFCFGVVILCAIRLFLGGGIF